jgi:hypothetical protein
VRRRARLRHSRPQRRPFIRGLSLVPSAVVQDESAISRAGAIARLQLLSHLRSFGVPNFFTMPSINRRSVADAIHKWHQNGYVDLQSEHTNTEKMAVCGCTSVRRALSYCALGAIEG